MLPAVRSIKRAIDVVGSLVGLAVSAPLLPIIAAAIYVDSPGPIFYRQRRASRLEGVSYENGRRKLKFHLFDMHKFRTMKTDAEKHTGVVVAGKDDPRVTRVGRFLRKSRLDELPQFWDVLRGEMSLVGPRPERPELIENLAYAIPFFEERMRGVKPGLTGLAQVSLGYTGSVIRGSEIEPLKRELQNPFEIEEADGAEADDMRMKLLYDLAYVVSLEELRSYLAMEARIILRTPLAMIKGTGR